jgi:hypothetical protein
MKKKAIIIVALGIAIIGLGYLLSLAVSTKSVPNSIKSDGTVIE